jgi:hypothetical protein
VPNSLPITPLDRDSAADPFDEAGFELPDEKRMIEQLMAGLAQARSKGLVSEASEETLRAFGVSEMKLYKHATTHKWTADELISTIKLIKSVNFRVDDINVDSELHKRVSAAIAQGYFSTGLFYYMSYSVVSFLLVSS